MKNYYGDVEPYKQNLESSNPKLDSDFSVKWYIIFPE
jgi:hypothetical protein